jgi:hypothetical protein
MIYTIYYKDKKLFRLDFGGLRINDPNVKWTTKKILNFTFAYGKKNRS